ncbi:hypothetical protein [Caballeronia arvi]|uniref:hypothetical protein n=1 Tax=Caballeronia arvi TaxID=1777135 RepID=UPI000ABCECC7|nr:hypothetical protein [Caballeronia arvi]
MPVWLPIDLTFASAMAHAVRKGWQINGRNLRVAVRIDVLSNTWLALGSRSAEQNTSRRAGGKEKRRTVAKTP